MLLLLLIFGNLANSHTPQTHLSKGRYGNWICFDLQRDLGKCKFDSRRKPPFLKGRFGGNVNINGGSAYSL